MSCSCQRDEWIVGPMFVTLLSRLLFIVQGILHVKSCQLRRTVLQAPTLNLISETKSGVESVWLFFLYFYERWFSIVCYHPLAIFQTSLVQAFTVYESKIRNTHLNKVFCPQKRQRTVEMNARESKKENAK